jgi:cyclic pyranopterin phosphate synthase
MEELSHMDEQGHPRMVDVSGKAESQRLAIAKGLVRMQAATFQRIKQGQVEKGDVLAVAQLAGIMAAKKTSQLIPLCHPIPIDEVKIDFALDEKNNSVEITAAVKSTGRTGVEMEALTATAIAALTIYDMVKGIDRGARLENVRLVKKSGGKSGEITLE